MSPQLLLGIGVAGIFVAIVLLLGIVGVFTTERAQVGRSLAVLEAFGGMPDSMRQEVDRSFADRVARPLLSRLAAIGRRLTPSGAAAKMGQRLDLAGNPSSWTVDRVYACKAGAMLGLGALGFLLGSNGGTALAVLLTVGFAVFGLFLPDVLLYNTGTKRQLVIQRNLPDAVDLLTISVEAGLGFDAAMSQVARNSKGPLAGELFRVLQEMQIGKSRGEAFNGLIARTNVPELRSFVTSLVQADAFGIPVANVLREQSKEMRSKRHQRAEEQAQKVPVKILFPLIFFILPALFTVIIGPGVLSIIDAFSS